MYTFYIGIRDEINKLIQVYISANKLRSSSFIHEAVFDKREDELQLETAEIVNVQKLLKKRFYDCMEV
jgi:hypothetical protein